MNKGFSVIGAVIAVAAILFIGGSYYLKHKANVVGGDKDAHGCIGSAGYSWCEAKQKCLRPFEETCTTAAPKTVTFNCSGGKSIVATFYPGRENDVAVDLVLSGGTKISVPRAISASGARYAKGDDGFVFWNKGDTAFITENGTTTYADCNLAQ